MALRLECTQQPAWHAAEIRAGARIPPNARNQYSYSDCHRHFKSQISPAAKSCILNEINRFELFTNGRSAQFSLRRPDLIIERSRLIRSLSEEAGEAGAQLDYDTRFLGLASNGTGLRVEVDQRGQRSELHAHSVIGADGATSRVARAAGWPAVETVPLVQGGDQAAEGLPPGYHSRVVHPDDTPYFYWLIPESKIEPPSASLANMAKPPKSASTAFLQKKGFEPLEWQGARIPVYKKWVPVQRSVGNGEVYLVGDAAAQVKVSTVGGDRHWTPWGAWRRRCDSPERQVRVTCITAGIRHTLANTPRTSFFSARRLFPARRYAQRFDSPVAWRNQPGRVHAPIMERCALPTSSYVDGFARFIARQEIKSTAYPRFMNTYLPEVELVPICRNC